MRLRGVNELFIHPYGWTKDSFTPRWMMKYSFDKASSKRKIYSVYNQYWISVGWLNKSSYLTLSSLGQLISDIFHLHFYCLLISVILIIPLFILLVNSLLIVFGSFLLYYFCILILGLVIRVYLVFWYLLSCIEHFLRSLNLWHLNSILTFFYLSHIQFWIPS